MLVDGAWTEDWYDTDKSDGRFERTTSTFRNWVHATGGNRFEAAPGRYHLYIANACPWAHRTAILRKLKGLEDIVSLDVVLPRFDENGWTFGDGDGLADPNFSGRATVPILWDRQEKTIVNNESADIVRIFNSEFDEWGRGDLDLYPKDLRSDIDRLNAEIYENVNNGVYRCGFASSQSAYDEAFDALFATLDELESRLERNRYLLGNRVTEADWRLFPTLIRFDIAYFGNFKCNKRPLTAYPNLWSYTRELYQWPGIAETVNFDHIKKTYYSIRNLNPTGIVPKGPELDPTVPHDRAVKFSGPSPC